MAKETISKQFKQKTLDTLLDNFSDERIMFASNFPLCLTLTTYQAVWEEHFNMELSTESWSKLSHQNAKRIYQVI